MISIIALEGVSKRAVPYSVGTKINEGMKRYSSDTLVFIDLLGYAKGSTYLFEEKYLQTRDALPEDFPYELIS